MDTSTPMGKAMFTIIAAMAELERNVIRERVVAGIDHARARGTKSGKPIGRPRAIFNRTEIAKLRASGFSWRAIAASLGIGVATARRAAEAVPRRPAEHAGSLELGAF